MRETIIDIGGGDGGYLSRLAKESPSKTFVILDPEVTKIANKPKNLSLFRWKSDADSGLPFTDSSVDEVRINYLMGEIRTKRNDSGSVGDSIEIYSELIKEVKRVLKKGGKVVVMDVRDNIQYISEVFKKYGFEVSDPVKVKDKGATSYTEMFSHLHNISKRSEDESFILPMQIEATK